MSRNTSRGDIGAHTPPRWRSAPVRTTTSWWSRLGTETVKAHRAPVWRPKAEQRFDECGLARAIRTQQGHDLAVVDVQRYVVDRAQVSKGDFEMIDLDVRSSCLTKLDGSRSRTLTAPR